MTESAKGGKRLAMKSEVSVEGKGKTDDNLTGDDDAPPPPRSAGSSEMGRGRDRVVRSALASRAPDLAAQARQFA